MAETRLIGSYPVIGIRPTIDGRTFWGKDWNICTVDGTHPTDLGFYKMAKKIRQVIDKILCN